jgi:hypothetical protein
VACTGVVGGVAPTTARKYFRLLVSQTLGLFDLRYPLKLHVTKPTVSGESSTLSSPSLHDPELNVELCRGKSTLSWGPWPTVLGAEVPRFGRGCMSVRARLAADKQACFGPLQV